MSEVKMFNEYGLWQVTTEGDCEGRSIRQLGIYEGHIDEIALGLSDKCCYSLTFTPVKATPLPVATHPRDSVSIQMDIESGTWNMSDEERIEYMEKMCSGRPVTFSKGQHYASTTMHFKPGDVHKARKAAALAKLTDEEKELLGLS